VTKRRRLSPDPALFRRRAAGETLRELARDYGVSHTSLSRYFARPQAVKELKRAAQLNRAEERAEEARWRAELRALEERWWAVREARPKSTAAQASRAERASARVPAAPTSPERGRGGAAGASAAASPAVRRKRLRGRASAEARGLVRLANPEGTLKTWVEAVKAPALLEAGWTRA
jgi:hypothetical protein